MLPWETRPWALIVVLLVAAAVLLVVGLVALARARRVRGAGTPRSD